MFNAINGYLRFEIVVTWGEIQNLKTVLIENLSLIYLNVYITNLSNQGLKPNFVTK